MSDSISVIQPQDVIEPNTNDLSQIDEDIDIDEGVQIEKKKVSIMDQMKAKFEKLMN